MDITIITYQIRQLTKNNREMLTIILKEVNGSGLFGKA